MDISVIICTRNRPDSLRQTLHSLAQCDDGGIQWEILVVDNASDEPLNPRLDGPCARLTVRWLAQPVLGVYGKSHALNLAARQPGLGDLIVVLDDDMSPDREWLRGICSIAQRHPEADFFTGNSYIIWPEQRVPEWAKDTRLHPWLFSVMQRNRDRTLGAGRWFSGNHFWFRRRCLQWETDFSDQWLTEPDFMLRLAERKIVGVAAPDARVGHRIQPNLLNAQTALQRAVLVGRSFAEIRFSERFPSTPYVRRSRQRPIASVFYSALQWMRWAAILSVTRLLPSASARMVWRLTATERIASWQRVSYILWSRLNRAG
jgi:glycosyltransferase involved in cell wall biosynthesis